MTPEETKEFIDKNFDEIVNRYIDAVVERGKETKGPKFKLTNDLREKVNDFVNETIEIFKNNLGDVGQVSVEDFIEFVKDRFEAARSQDVIDTLLDEYKEDDDLDVDDMMRRAAAEDENEYDRNTYGDNTKTDAVSTIVAPMVNLAKKKLKEKLVEFMVKKAAEKFGTLSDDVIDDIVGYIKQLADVCKNDEQTMKTIFNKGYGSIPSYKDALNWILEKGTSEDLKAEGENLITSEDDESLFENRSSYNIEYYPHVYVGRTDEYYNEDPDDDGVFGNSYKWWTWSEEADDSDFANEGPVFELTEDGKEDFFEWLDAEQVGPNLGDGRLIDWPKKHLSHEDEWEYLTNPKNGLSKRVR